MGGEKDEVNKRSERREGVRGEREWEERRMK